MSEFKLEERYVVFKLKRMSEEEKSVLEDFIYLNNLEEAASVPCIVIEEDWPEYQAALDSIRERVEGV